MKNRDISIDGMKGTLVVFMILAHLTQFFSIGPIGEKISLYVNLTTFSGFMFTFGYVCYKAYINKNISSFDLRKKLRKNFFKTLVAFYISGIANTLLVYDNLSLSTLVQILFLWKIPGHSEFLLSFALIYPLIYLFQPILKKMNAHHYVIVAIISLLMTFIKYNTIQIPLLGVFIGTTTFACFPIIQYLSYFLAGMFFAQDGRIYNKLIIILSIIGSGSFISYYIHFDSEPTRFPPSITWIVGGYLFVLLYFIIWKKYSIYLSKLKLHIIGQNTLIYLLISNLIIFTLYKIGVYSFASDNTYKIIIFYILCFGSCISIPYLYCKYKAH